MSVDVQRKPLVVKAWNLTAQEEMLDALSFLSEHGWRGALAYDTATNLWRLELNADDPVRQVLASIGDWLVFDLDLRKLSAEELAANYEEVAGS